MKIQTKKITAIAMLCALTYVFMFASKIIPPVEGFLQYDAKDVVITIGGFIFGPMSTIIISVVVAFLEFLTVSHTGPIGLVMNIISTVSFSFVASLVYHKRKTLGGAFLSLLIGTISLVVVMLLWNYYITPLYMNVPREAIKVMLPTVFLPFNAIKGTINSGFILFMYRPLVIALQKAGLVEKKQSNSKRSIFSLTFFIGILIVVVSIPLVFYLFNL